MLLQKACDIMIVEQVAHIASAQTLVPAIKRASSRKPGPAGFSSQQEKAGSHGLL